jgi:hypothetical protein
MMPPHSVALLLRADAQDAASDGEEQPRQVLSVVAYHWQSITHTAQVRTVGGSALHAWRTTALTRAGGRSRSLRRPWRCAAAATSVGCWLACSRS